MIHCWCYSRLYYLQTQCLIRARPLGWCLRQQHSEHPHQMTFSQVYISCSSFCHVKPQSLEHAPWQKSGILEGWAGDFARITEFLGQTERPYDLKKKRSQQISHRAENKLSNGELRLMYWMWFVSTAGDKFDPLRPCVVQYPSFFYWYHSLWVASSRCGSDYQRQAQSPQHG